jgi:hypothetical protein
MNSQDDLDITAAAVVALIVVYLAFTLLTFVSHFIGE